MKDIYLILNPYEALDAFERVNYLDLYTLNAACGVFFAPDYLEYCGVGQSKDCPYPAKIGSFQEVFKKFVEFYPPETAFIFVPIEWLFDMEKIGQWIDECGEKGVKNDNLYRAFRNMARESLVTKFDDEDYNYHIQWID